MLYDDEIIFYSFTNINMLLKIELLFEIFNTVVPKDFSFFFSRTDSHRIAHLVDVMVLVGCNAAAADQAAIQMNLAFNC